MSFISKNRYLKNFSLCLLLVSACTLLGSFTHKAAAINNTIIGSVAPLPGSSNVTNGGTMQPWFAVGTGEFDGSVSYAKVYVGNSTDATLTIKQAPCSVDIGTPDVVYTVWKLNSGENLSGTDPKKVWTRTIMGTNNCGGGDPTAPLSADTENSSQKGHENYNVFLLEAQILDDNAPGTDNEHSFRLSVDGTGNLVGLSAPVIASNTKPWFGIYQRDAPTNSNWDWAAQFAPNCTQAIPPESQYVDIYDIDYGVYPQPNLHAGIEKDARGGTFAWAPASDGNTVNPTSPPSLNSSPTYAHRDANAALAQYQFVSGDHTRNDLSFVADNGYRNRILFTDVNWRNTIQVTLPYDQFNARLTPSDCSTNPPPNPQPTPPPPGPARCDILNQPILTTPGAAVNFTVRVFAGTSALVPGPQKLFIVGPPAPPGIPKLTGSFNLPRTIQPGDYADMTVSVVGSANYPIPTAANTYPNFRTYQLGNSQTDTFGGTCSPTLVVQNTVFNGDLSELDCRMFSGHIWDTETDGNVLAGRLAISPAPGVVYYTDPFPTAGGAHQSGGQWWDIDPFMYVAPTPDNPHPQVGPAIDIQLHYRDQYNVTLQAPNGSGGWDNLTAPTHMQYPCLTGTLAASCTSASGSLNYKSTATGPITGALEADGNTGVYTPFFPNASNFNYDPFSYAQMGSVQMLPHVGHSIGLEFWDTDNSGPWLAPNDDGSQQVIKPINGGNPCLTFNGCAPAVASFEVNGSSPADLSMGYSNYTQDYFGGGPTGYYGTMSATRPGTVLINGGTTGPNSTDPSIFSTLVSPNSLNYPTVSLSSTGPPYNGDIVLTATYQGAAIGGGSCTISVGQVTKPYFKAFGASASTGGAFADPSTPTSSTCSTSNPGGVRAFAHFNPPYTSNSPNDYVGGNQKSGASIEYSIESLGLIQGDSPGGYGFYSGDTHDNAGDYINTLDVGDQTPPVGGWGGNLSGGHCIPDYYHAKITGGETSWDSGPLAGATIDHMFGVASQTPENAEAFSANPGPGKAINLGASVSSIEDDDSYCPNPPYNNGVCPYSGRDFRGGTRVTLFVNGDVYLSSDVIYGDAYTGSNPNLGTGRKYDPTKTSGPIGEGDTRPPFFTVIATGSIYVAPGVQELDGLYIAEGLNGTKGGEAAPDGFSTCGVISADNTTASNEPRYVIGPNPGQVCNQKLVVNGAVVASQLKLLRVGGVSNTLNNAGSDNGSSIYSNPANCANVAPPCPRNNNSVEEFNYTPDMVENSPYYLGGSCVNLCGTESISSLPPVY